MVLKWWSFGFILAMLPWERFLSVLWWHCSSTNILLYGLLLPSMNPEVIPCNIIFTIFSLVCFFHYQLFAFRLHPLAKIKNSTNSSPLFCSKNILNSLNLHEFSLRMKTHIFCEKSSITSRESLVLVNDVVFNGSYIYACTSSNAVLAFQALKVLINSVHSPFPNMLHVSPPSS